jgi:hydrogenase assembly chaperone HypC/HupF
MCLVSPARVVAVDGPTATLEVDGRRRAASILLEPGVVVGDWVIVAGGAVLRRIAPTDADAMRSALARMTPDTTGGAPR